MSSHDPSPSLPPGPSGQVVWRRTIDVERQRRRSQSLLRFALAAVAVSVVVAVSVDPGSALGVVVVAVLVGLLGSLYVFGVAMQERGGDSIIVNGSVLSCGAVTVPVAEVQSFTTSFRMVLRKGHPGLAGWHGSAVFHLVDGSIRQFEWQRMPADQIDAVRVALDKVLPGRWQPHEQI